MARYSASARSSLAATSARGVSLYAATSGARIAIREIAVWNTTTTAFAVSVARLTARGTPGTGVTAAKFNPGSGAATATPYQVHTADATASDEVKRASIAAAIGAGVVWQFGGDGLVISESANTNGVGILCPTGTGQVYDFYIEWEE